MILNGRNTLESELKDSFILICQLLKFSSYLTWHLYSDNVNQTSNKVWPWTSNLSKNN